MPESELCSYCYVERNAMMARTPYSTYDEFYQGRLEYIYTQCGGDGPTDIPDPLIPLPVDSDVCLSGLKHVTSEGDTCDALAEEHSFASASLQMGNINKIANCSEIDADVELCLPLSCEKTYVVEKNDTCIQVEGRHYDNGIRRGDIRRYNPWVDKPCSNLWTASDSVYGHVICLSPQNGVANATIPDIGAPNRPGQGGRPGWTPSEPPEGADIPEGTTRRCATWHMVPENDNGKTSCALMCVNGGSTVDVLMAANPSLGDDVADCSAKIKPGITYCALPAVGWDWDWDEVEEE
jgi:hypothetical protein